MAYVENILKQYVRRNKIKICMACYEVLPKISALQNKIMINNEETSEEMQYCEVMHEL